MQSGTSTNHQGKVHLQHSGGDAELVQIEHQLVQQGQCEKWLVKLLQILQEKGQLIQPSRLYQQQELLGLVLFMHGGEGMMVQDSEILRRFHGDMDTIQHDLSQIRQSALVIFRSF